MFTVSDFYLMQKKNMWPKKKKKKKKKTQSNLQFIVK